MASMSGIEDPNRRYCYRFRGVQVDEFMFALLCLLELASNPTVDFEFSLLERLWVDGFAELLEDLRYLSVN